jgi:hypothetical protein
MVFAVAFVVLHLAAILHFLLMVLIGTVVTGTAITVVAAFTAWRMHAIKPAATARYTVEVSDQHVIDGQIVQGGIHGAGQKALEAGPARGAALGLGEQPTAYLGRWADGSLVRPIRHSQ